MSFLVSLLMLSLSGCVREVFVKVPAAPEPCVIPAFHEPKDCTNPQGDISKMIDCYMVDYSVMIGVDQQIKAALQTCPEVHLVLLSGEAHVLGK